MIIIENVLVTAIEVVWRTLIYVKNIMIIFSGQYKVEKFELKSKYDTNNETNLSFEDYLSLTNKLKSISSPEEKQFLLEEIFVDKSYENNSIFSNIPKQNAVIIDVGANLGYFTVYCNAKYRDSQIFSIEMVPQIYDALNENIKISNDFLKNGNSIKSYNYAIISDVINEFVECIFFPYWSSWSTLRNNWPWHGNEQAGRQAFETQVKNYYSLNESNMLYKFVTKIFTSIVYFKHTSKAQIIKVKTSGISKLILNENLRKIDLLKVDVEGSEWSVLQTIGEQDWEKISNVVIEIQENKEKIITLLKNNGFNKIECVQDKVFKNTQWCNCFASKV